MKQGRDPEEAAAALRVSIGMLVRRLRQTQVDGDLTMPETSALARIDRGGPTTSAALAKLEQISPQSMGATLAGLEARGYLARATDPDDGRRVVLSLTGDGLRVLGDRRHARVAAMAEALRGSFTEEEVAQLLAAAPLLERLAEAL